MEDHAGVGAERLRHLAGHACSRDQRDLDGVMLDEPERPFKHKTAQRIDDNLRALKVAAMDKRVGLVERAGAHSCDGVCMLFLGSNGPGEWVANIKTICVDGPWSPRPSTRAEKGGFGRNVIDRLRKGRDLHAAEEMPWVSRPLAWAQVFWVDFGQSYQWR
jgi:hypothetical protein